MVRDTSKGFTRCQPWVISSDGPDGHTHLEPIFMPVMTVAMSLDTDIQPVGCFSFKWNSVEIALQQNEIMNTFIDDWKNLAEEESTFGDKTDTHLKEYQSFTDLHSTMEKMITCVSWHPTIYGKEGMPGVPFRADFERVLLPYIKLKMRLTSTYL